MSIYTPPAINTHVQAGGTDRYALVDGLMRNGIMTNLDKYRFVSGLVTNATIRKGQMFEEWTRWGNVGSEYHKLGTEILPQEAKRDRYRIFLDERPLVTATAYDDWEDFVTNVPHQAQMADRMAYELSTQWEIETIKQCILSGRDAGNKAESDQFLGGGLQGVGNPLTLGASGNVSDYLAAITAIDQNWFEIGSMGAEAYALVDADDWYALWESGEVFITGVDGSDAQKQGFAASGNGPSLAAGSPMDAALQYKGVKFIRSNLANKVFGKDRSTDMYRKLNAASQNRNVDSLAGATVSGTSVVTKGVVFKPDAVAMVQATSPQFERERRAGFQTNAVYGTQLMGGGSLYAENAIELVTHS